MDKIFSTITTAFLVFAFAFSADAQGNPIPKDLVKQGVLILPNSGKCESYSAIFVEPQLRIKYGTLFANKESWKNVTRLIMTDARTTDWAFGQIPTMNAVVHLSIVSNKITDKSLAKIPRMFPNVETVRVCCPQMTIKSLKIICAMDSCKKVIVDAPDNIKKKEADAIEKRPFLEMNYWNIPDAADKRAE